MVTPKLFRRLWGHRGRNWPAPDGLDRDSQEADAQGGAHGQLEPEGPDEQRVDQHEPGRALQWRLDVRQMFEAYFAKGYRAVDFVLQRENGFGRYLLAKDKE